MWKMFTKNSSPWHCNCFQTWNYALNLENLNSSTANNGHSYADMDHHKIKILLIDDVQTNRMLLGKLLDKWNLPYAEASNALDAFEMISDRSYTHVLMDVEMPDVDGLEATRFIRKLHHPYFQRIPIIAVTSYRLEEIRRKALLAGMTDCISKPIDPEPLKASIYRTYLENLDHRMAG